MGRITVAVRAVSVVAVLAVGSVCWVGCGGDSGANTGGGGDNNGGTTTYLVSVSSAGTGATGGGSYAAGAVVTISAGTPPSGYTFTEWTTTSSGVVFKNAGSATTWFTMPANAVTVSANFQQNSVTPPGGGGSYESVVIGGKKWMKKNLDLVTEGARCYGEGSQVIDGRDESGSEVFKTLSPSEIQANCNMYGRLYTWAAAKRACQSIGWRLPDTADWNHLVEAVGGRNTAGKKLKAKSGWNLNEYGEVGGNGTDDFGFSALPGGFYGHGDGDDNSNIYIFAGSGYSGAWWFATEYESGRPWFLSMTNNDDKVYGGISDVVDGASVRCVKDD